MGAPNLSKSPSQSPAFKYIDGLSNTPVDIFSGPGNLYGFQVEDNSGADIFLQIFFKPASQVTVGTTPPDATFRISASGVVGRDPSSHALYFSGNSLSVAVTTGRTSNVAPSVGATAQFWYWNT